MKTNINGRNAKGEKMKPFNFTWAVKIRSGCFMAGTHRFKTKKDAQDFIEKWNHLPENKNDINAVTYFPTAVKVWEHASE